MGRRQDKTPDAPLDLELMVLQYQQNFEAALTQLVREVGYTGKFTAILGDGNGTIIVPQAEQGLPRTFYVRKVDQFNNPTDVLEAVQEWDGLSYSNHQADVWVTCARRPGAPYVSIIGPADPWTAYASHGGATPAQYESFKAKIPTLSRVAELRLRPGNGTQVKVSEGAWWVGNTLYHTHEKVLGDLAAYIPATAGQAKYVLVGIDTAGDMQVTDGDEYDIAALPRPAESGVNTKANGVHGLGHVRLVNDIAQVAETDIVPRHAIPTVVSSGSVDGVLPGYFGGRLTPTSGVPAPTANATGVTILYCTPTDKDINVLDVGYAKLFNTTTSEWETHAWSEISAGVPSTTNSVHDVFFGYNSGSEVYELSFSGAWTNDTTRSTALGDEGGIKVQSSDHSKLWIGIIKTTSVSGETESSVLAQNGKRFIVNKYNQVELSLWVHDDDDYWQCNNTNWEIWNASTDNKVSYIYIDNGKHVWLDVLGSAYNTVGSTGVGIGMDSTSVNSAQLFNNSGGARESISCSGWFRPSEGVHSNYPLQRVNVASTATVYGKASTGPQIQTGIKGKVWG